jgi:C-terminal processing protease CtpA/Prc
MNNKLRFLMPATVLTVILLFSVLSCAQARPGQTDLPINAATRTEVIESVLRRLTHSYVLPEVAAQMEKSIRLRIQKGEYNQINSSTVLAQTLASHLREISNDKHLGVNFSYEPIPVNEKQSEPTAEEKEMFRRFAAAQNFGFEKVERLNGNVGFMELNGFINPELGAEKVIAAMSFLADTDALIIDLRYNGGGEPGLAQLISTYFFSGKPVQLHSIYWREGNWTQQYWTLPSVPGKRYVDKPIFILTSKRTFSAPESFAYSLQALKRATIVGETTRGGANPAKDFRINEHFSMLVPIGRAVNPVTGTNWEGTGIKPDIEATEAQALKTAHLAALRKLLDTSTSERKKMMLKGVIEEVEKQS